MREGGASFRQIADEIGVHHRTIQKWCEGGD